MVPQASRLNNVRYDIRGPVLRRARQLEAEGHRILKLNIGNTAPFGLMAPDSVVTELVQNIGEAQGYSDARGIHSARLAVACTECGACYRACPMVPRTPPLADAAPEAVMAGIRDILRDGGGTPEAIAFAGACTRSGVCSAACPEQLDAAFLMRLASLRVRGALGDPPRVAPKHDAGWSARVKAFARLTMNQEEQATWL